jgi:hypothetical protein
MYIYYVAQNLQPYLWEQIVMDRPSYYAYHVLISFWLLQ